MSKKAFLVRLPQYNHDVIRSESKNNLFNYESIRYTQVNELLSSKTITQLLNAVVSLPMSLPAMFDGGVFIGCEFSQDNYLKVITNSHDDERLLYKEISTLPNENVDTEGIGDLYEKYIVSVESHREFLEWLTLIDARNDNDVFKFWEPLSNWIFIRNFTAFLLKTRYYSAQGFSKEDLLLKVGFTKSSLGWIYLLKNDDFKTDDITYEKAFLKNSNRENDEFENGVVLGRGDAYAMDSSYEIGFRPSLSLMYQEGNEYLLFDVSDSHIFDINYGDEILRCVFSMFDSKPYGWGYNGPRKITNESMAPELQARSALAQFVLKAFSVHTDEIDFCKQCGTVLLSTGKGRRKEFCSTVCRVKFSRANRQ